MPDKPFTVITYAASASLAAIALVYFFNPNYLIDGDSSSTSASTRRKGVVGLSNPANDCFINSILQSLAGLGDLRLYLIRELHRRKLDGSEIYASVPNTSKDGKPINPRKLQSLQSGEVTKGLKDIIDGLNERPIYRKTISAGNFIAVLEHAFGTRISKSQQDAQELLQVVAERLSEEYHAGREARRRARNDSVGDLDDAANPIPGLGLSVLEPYEENSDNMMPIRPLPDERRNDGTDNSEDIDPVLDGEDGFPLEGRTESLIECQYCHFVPKANSTTFVMLTLTVPQKSSTTLNECFDTHFKPEFIDDYKCDKCRLEHALEVTTKSLSRATSEKQKAKLQADFEKVKKSLEEDPEKPPEGVELPDSKLAPKRRIARHIQITAFPKILVIHLSRSIYDPRSSSTKNAAKVSFPEKLPLGSLLNRRNYKLLGLVTHKGTHNSGHYESFRRQHLYAPYSTPHVRKTSGPYSASVTPEPSTLPSPKIPATPNTHLNVLNLPLASSEVGELLSPSILSSSPSRSSASLSSPSTRPSSGSISGSIAYKKPPTSVPRGAQLSDVVEQTNSILGKPSRATSVSVSSGAPAHESSRRKRKFNDRWWRISDDRVKECKTSDVLGMQKEVYMLFYETEKD
ncbi:hypothetical protein MMC24_001122 [Lignoscripta atroalba]|nr:hypothetical protein [Lignoscripta atroalba]